MGGFLLDLLILIFGEKVRQRIDSNAGLHAKTAVETKGDMFAGAISGVITTVIFLVFLGVFILGFFDMPAFAIPVLASGLVGGAIARRLQAGTQGAIAAGVVTGLVLGILSFMVLGSIYMN